MTYDRTPCRIVLLYDTGDELRVKIRAHVKNCKNCLDRIADIWLADYFIKSGLTEKPKNV